LFLLESCPAFWPNSVKVTEKPSRHWIKVKNPRYSQLEGREELFERN
jgi:hypothetical protein